MCFRIQNLEFRNQSQHLRVLCSFVNVVQGDSAKTQLCVLRRGPSLIAKLDTISMEYGGASVWELGLSRAGLVFSCLVISFKALQVTMPTENAVFAQVGTHSCFGASCFRGFSA